MSCSWVSECSEGSPAVTVILLIMLIFEALLFAIFTLVMFASQVQAIWNDETVSEGDCPIPSPHGARGVNVVLFPIDTRV